MGQVKTNKPVASLSERDVIIARDQYTAQEVRLTCEVKGHRYADGTGVVNMVVKTPYGPISFHGKYTPDSGWDNGLVTEYRDRNLRFAMPSEWTRVSEMVARSA